MKYIKLGNSDIDISKIIMGTWQAGKKMWAGIDDSETIKAMRAAFDKGISTFDTATVYGDGHSEQIIAKALGSVRHDIVIITKVFPHNLAYGKVFDACHKSLKDLKTDYIDLYLIHWPSGSFGSKKVPIEESMNALNELKKQGKIREIGVSNFSLDELKEAREFGEITSLEPPYSLFWRHIEKELMPYCNENNITILAYSPLAQGILTGKFGDNPRFKKGDHRQKNRLFEPEIYKEVLLALDKLKPVAKKNNLTLAQLALAWVISHKNTCAIAGARNSVQASENAAAGDIILSSEDMEEMDLISGPVTELPGDNPVLWKW